MVHVRWADSQRKAQQKMVLLTGPARCQACRMMLLPLTERPMPAHSIPWAWMVMAERM